MWKYVLKHSICLETFQVIWKLSQSTRFLGLLSKIDIPESSSSAGLCALLPCRFTSSTTMSCVHLFLDVALTGSHHELWSVSRDHSWYLLSLWGWFIACDLVSSDIKQCNGRAWNISCLLVFLDDAITGAARILKCLSVVWKRENWLVKVNPLLLSGTKKQQQRLQKICAVLIAQRSLCLQSAMQILHGKAFLSTGV